MDVFQSVDQTGWFVLDVRDWVGEDQRQAREGKTGESGKVEFVISNGEGGWVHSKASGCNGNFVWSGEDVTVVSCGYGNAGANGGYNPAIARFPKGFMIGDVPPVLLVTDLDGTLVGHDEAMRRFFDIWTTHFEWRGSVLVYNTGRSLDSVLRLFKDKDMKYPTALITGVGTQVYWFTAESGEDSRHRRAIQPALDEAFVMSLNQGGWSTSQVREVVGGFVSRLNSRGVDIHWRPEEEQLPHKLSLGVRDHAVDATVSELQKTLLETCGIEVQLIISGHGDWRYLDVVSIAGGKHSALQYVRSQLSKRTINMSHKIKPTNAVLSTFDFPYTEANTLTAGDSGNDIAMLDGPEFGVIMGNAQAELRNWYQHGLAADRRSRKHLAQATFADGILEGLAHFKFLPKAL